MRWKLVLVDRLFGIDVGHIVNGPAYNYIYGSTNMGGSLRLLESGVLGFWGFGALGLWGSGVLVCIGALMKSRLKGEAR